MSRDVPFNPKAVCDICGATGAYDFMGDYSCQKCTDEAFADDRLAEDEANAESRAVIKGPVK
jgi:hypothetical protein